METKYYYLLIGIVIGWITKVPFLIKWYKEFKDHKQHMAIMWGKLNREGAFLCAKSSENRCEKQCFTCTEDEKCDNRNISPSNK